MILFPCSPSREVITEALNLFSSWTGEKVREGDCLYRAIPGVAKDFAGLRVINFDSRDLNTEPFPIEVDFERRKTESCQCGKGTVYAGIQLAMLFRKRLLTDGIRLQETPLFVTRDYIATFDSDDLRWHLRYGVFSFPSIISLPGIIEAPARPREYYLLRAQGVPDEMMPERLKERYLTVGDARFPRVLAGILLQAFFYHQIGDPFCSDPLCSLYHAHWQEELLRSQGDEPYILCPIHQRVINEGRGRWARG